MTKETITITAAEVANHPLATFDKVDRGRLFQIQLEKRQFIDRDERLYAGYMFVLCAVAQAAAVFKKNGIVPDDPLFMRKGLRHGTTEMLHMAQRNLESVGYDYMSYNTLDHPSKKTVQLANELRAVTKAQLQTTRHYTDHERSVLIYAMLLLKEVETFLKESIERCTKTGATSGGRLHNVFFLPHVVRDGVKLANCDVDEIRARLPVGPSREKSYGSIG